MHLDTLRQCSFSRTASSSRKWDKIAPGPKKEEYSYGTKRGKNKSRGQISGFVSHLGSREIIRDVARDLIFALVFVPPTHYTIAAIAAAFLSRTNPGARRIATKLKINTCSGILKVY